MERRLAAILSADVVGYARLMGSDEPGTLEALKSDRSRIFEPKARQYGGRIIKVMGDGILMEFASAVQAVSFAVAVQNLAMSRNDTLPEAQRILYRIGINVGDIIVEGQDIYGDGVNIAARLESLSEPGGVCLARNVYSQVKDKLELTFEHLGEKAIKNIADPVSVYRIAFDEKSAALAEPVEEVLSVATKSRRWPITIAFLILLSVALGGYYYWQRQQPEFETAKPANMSFPLPNKPSIAVLPFANIGGDKSQEYFADGITNDLITDLSKFNHLFVIAANSTFTYKGKAVKVRVVAEELGVQYVLEGSVQYSGDTMRINAQLIDAVSGHHIWAERYDRKADDLFTIQNEIIRTILATLNLQVQDAEINRALKQ